MASALGMNRGKTPPPDPFATIQSAIADPAALPFVRQAAINRRCEENVNYMLAVPQMRAAMNNPRLAIHERVAAFEPHVTKFLGGANLNVSFGNLQAMRAAWESGDLRATLEHFESAEAEVIRLLGQNNVLPEARQLAAEHDARRRKESVMGRISATLSRDSETKRPVTPTSPSSSGTSSRDVASEEFEKSAAVQAWLSRWETPGVQASTYDTSGTSHASSTSGVATAGSSTSPALATSAHSRKESDPLPPPADDDGPLPPPDRPPSPDAPAASAGSTAAAVNPAATAAQEKADFVDSCNQFLHPGTTLTQRILILDTEIVPALTGNPSFRINGLNNTTLATAAVFSRQTGQLPSDITEDALITLVTAARDTAING